MPAPAKIFGWTPSPPDAHDKLFRLQMPVTARPAKFSLNNPPPGAPFNPAYDQGAIGSCFPSDTLIRMADGNEKPITDVRLGEEVVTAEGRTGMVTQVMMRPAPEDGLIRLSLWGRSEVRMTSEHPVLTARGYVAAKDLTFDDMVALTRYRPAFPNKTIQTAELLSKKEICLRRTRVNFGKLPGRADTSTCAAVKAAIPESIELTERFGRLVGLFLAEGSTDSGKVRWTFGAHEEKTLVAETVDLLKDLGVEAYLQHKLGHNSINVVAYGTAWARLWERLCGNGAGKKQVNGLLMSGSDEFLKGLLEGWLAGDGHCERDKSGKTSRNRGKSISKNLAMCMYDIAQGFGMQPVFKTELGKPSGNVKSRQDVYIVELNSHLFEDNWRSRQTDTHVFRKIRRIERQPYDGYVYNLSVYGDNSYVADGVGVHNCGPNSQAKALSFALLNAVNTLAAAVVAAGAPKMPSRLFMYWTTRKEMGTVNEDSGVYNRVMLKALGKYGWCDEDIWPYDVSKFAVQPDAAAFAQAESRANGIVYQSVPQTENDMKGVLYDLKRPIITGFTVYQSMLTAQVEASGDVPMPGGFFDKVAGGHDVLTVGWDDASQTWDFGNSWGQWGNNGYGRFPKRYLLDPDLSNDFWAVTAVPNIGPIPVPPTPPTPPVPPGPTPPAPPSPVIDIRAIVDALFAAVIAQTQSPILKRVLQIAQKLIDAFIDQALSQVQVGILGGLARKVIDMAFDLAVIWATGQGKTLLADALKLAKQLVDAYLDVHPI